MQFINKILNSRRGVLVLLGLFLLAVLFVIMLAAKSSQSTYKPNDYYDDFSKQTVSDPENKDPEVAEGEINNGIIFLGFNELLNYGFTKNQLTSLENSLVASGLANKYEHKEITIRVDGLTKQSLNNPNGKFVEEVSTDIKFGRTKVATLKVDFFDLTKINVKVLDGNTVLYSSGTIDTYSGGE